MTTKEKIEAYLKEYPYKKYYFNTMSKINPSLVEEIRSFPLAIPSDSFLSERMFCILNDLNERPKCKTCGKKSVTFDSGNFRYRRFCCASCGQLDSDVQHKLESSCMQKFGVKRACQSKEILEKSKQRCIERYGRWYLGSKDCQEKTKQTNLKRYGVESAIQSNEIKEKVKKTCLERYGVEYSFQSDNNKEKTKQTLLKKYGVEKIGNSKEIRDKIHKTNLEKYGVSMPFLDKEIYEKTYTTISKNAYKKLLDDDNFQPLFSLDEFIRSKKDNQPLKWKCKKCGNEFFSFLDVNSMTRLGIIVRCYNCYPRLGGTSRSEKEVFSFVQKIDSEAISDTKKILPNGFQLDIFVPSKKLAIEFDGLYWHSEENKNSSNYHLFKTEECEKKDIQLIHIFEDEWLYKQDIVKSRIKNLLGIYDSKCFARQCEVKEVSSKESFDFQEANHIQGAVNSKVNLGLYFKDELVSLMTFSKPRFDKKHEWELVRFCNKLGWHIPGAASKLLAHFEKEYKPKNIVSYADRRWSKGNLYRQLSFELDHISPPDYFYFNKSDFYRESRVKYQKHKLPDLLEIFDPKLTESQNMANNGFYKIWDCGNLVFVKSYN